MPKPNNGPQLAINDAGIYEIRWTEGRRSKRKSCHTDDRQQAEASLGRFLIGRSEEKKVSTANVAAILDAYYNEHVLKKCVAKQRQECCIAVLKAGLGTYDVQQLTPEVVSTYEAIRRSGKLNGNKVGDSTIRRELTCLGSALNHAVRHRRILPVDRPHIELPAKAPPKDLWLTSAQLDTLVEVAAKTNKERMSRIYRFIVLASETASRKNAIITLRWQQVDLNARLIHFQNDGNQRTKKRRVAVPMSDVLHAMLTKAWAERTQDEWVLDVPTTLQRQFDAVTAAAGKGFEAVTPHTLRHTWATLAAQAGVPLFEIAGVLGDTLATVMEVYAHHSPDHLRGAVNFRAQPARNAPLSPPTTTDRNGQVLVFKAG